MYKNVIKRAADMLVALVVFIVLVPVFIFVVVALYLVNRGSVFFTQLRPGEDGKIFRLVKFKTMTDERDSDGELLPDSKRLTKIGDFIRKTSLDEVPQLLNVIKGDMSIVGPRPLLVEYLELYNTTQARRHCVKPGITGWAQINGRNAISWEKKFDLDVWYVENQSFLLDIKILWGTVFKVVKSEGISSDSSVTMERFLGKKK